MPPDYRAWEPDLLVLHQELASPGRRLVLIKEDGWDAFPTRFYIELALWGLR